MLHHLTGATIQVSNLVNYNCHPQEVGNKWVSSAGFSKLHLFKKAFRNTSRVSNGLNPDRDQTVCKACAEQESFFRRCQTLTTFLVD